jgi:hypothetical protein
MSARKEINRRFDQAIRQQVKAVKTGSLQFDLDDVKESLNNRLERLAGTFVKLLNKCRGGGDVVVPNELKEEITQVEADVIFMDWRGIVDHQVDRWDNRRKVQNLLKTRLMRSGSEQEEFTLYNPYANLVLAPRIRVQMAEASRLQAQEAKTFGVSEYDRIEKGIQRAREEYEEYFDSRLNIWVPRYNNFDQLERGVFNWTDAKKAQCKRELNEENGEVEESDDSTD